MFVFHVARGGCSSNETRYDEQIFQDEFCVVLCCVVLCCCWTPAGNYSVLDENVKGANPKNAPFVIRARVVRITII